MKKLDDKIRIFLDSCLIKGDYSIGYRVLQRVKDKMSKEDYINYRRDYDLKLKEVRCLKERK